LRTSKEKTSLDGLFKQMYFCSKRADQKVTFNLQYDSYFKLLFMNIGH